MAIMMGCSNIDGVSFLKEFPWISCSSSEYRGLLVIAVMQVLYVSIFPVALCLYFRCIGVDQHDTASNDGGTTEGQHDTASNDGGTTEGQHDTASNDGGTTEGRHDTASNDRGTTEGRRDIATSDGGTTENRRDTDEKWYSSFLAQYTEKYRDLKVLYFMLRRLSIAIIMAKLQNYPPVLTSLSTMLLLLFIFIQAFARPFKCPMQNTDNTQEYFDVENVIDIFMLSTMEVSIVCAEMSTGSEDWVQNTLLVFIYFTNVPFIVILFCYIVFRIRDELRSQTNNQNNGVQQVTQRAPLSQDSSNTVSQNLQACA